jgi:uncharacterized protein YjbI with pentapeptide repeats
MVIAKAHLHPHPHRRLKDTTKQLISTPETPSLKRIKVIRLSELASISMLIALIMMIEVGECDARTVQASEILAKIVAQSPVNYTNVTIEGDLTFNDGYVAVGKSFLANISTIKNSISRFTSSASCTSSRLTNFTQIGGPITNNGYITRRVVILHHSFIKGPIIITNSTSIKSPITIKDSIIKGVVQFNNTTFQAPVLITNTTFCKDAYFVRSKFCHYVDFSRSDFAFSDFSLANFTKYVNFEQATFNGFSAFPGTTFSGCADFDGARFNGYADFFATRIVPYDRASQGDDPRLKMRWYGDQEAPKLYPLMEIGTHLKVQQISSNISFDSANFSNSANFVGSIFDQSVSFYGVRFDGPALFTGSNFTKDSHFEAANFLGDCDFLGANFSGQVCFNEAIFHGFAYFPNAYFNNSADFGGAIFAGNATFHDTIFIGLFDLDRTRFISMQLENTWFGPKSSLRLDDSDLIRSGSSSLWVSWDAIKNSLVPSGPVYLSLIRNFKNLEQFGDADNCYYQYRKWRQDLTSWSEGSKYTDILAHWSCGYGVKPGFVLFWLIFLIGSFGFLFYNGNGIKFEPGPHSDERASSLDACYYSFMVLIGASTDLKPVKRYRYLVAVERFLGWLLLALFIITLAHIMIR